MQIPIGTPYVKIICVKEQLKIIQIPIGKLTSLKTFWGQTNALMIVNVMEWERVADMVGVEENREIDIHIYIYIYIVIYNIRNKFGRIYYLFNRNIFK